MRYTRALAALLILAITLSACSLGGETAQEGATALPDAASPPQTQANPVSSEPITITFGGQEFERQMYTPLIETFNAQNPDIRVQFVSLDEALNSGPNQPFDPVQYTRQIVSAADTASLFFVEPLAVKQGFFANLKPLIDADPTFEPNDFYPNALASTSDDGALYLLPRSLRVPLIAYNKDLWAASGLPEPKPDWSWADMLAAAEQLVKKRGDQIEVYGFLDWNSAFTALMSELAARDITLFNTSAEQIRLDTSEIAAALEQVAKLATAGVIYARPSSGSGVISSDDFQRLIKGQQAAMWRADLLFSGPNQDKPPFEIGMAAFPPDDLPFWSGPGQGYVISSGSQQPEAAWRWLSFLSKQEIKPPFEIPNQLSEVPARPSLAERSGYWSKLDEQTAAAVRAVLERPNPPANQSFNQQLFGPLSQAIDAVIAGEKKAADALHEAQSQYDEQLAQIQSTPTAAPGPIVVATPAVEVAAEGATTITFKTLGFDPTQVRKLARAFNQNNPEIFVDVQNTESFTGPVSLEQIASDADCFTWWGVPGKNEITATLDLKPLIDADGSFDQTDYPPALLKPFQQGTAQYGLPLEINFRVLTYNKTAFERAGLTPPSAAWTLDTFLDAAQRLTSGEGKDKTYGFASQNGGAQDIFFFLHRLGVKATTGSGESVQPNFTDQKLVQAIRTYLDLLQKDSPHDKLYGYERDSWSDQAFQLIQQGRVGMWFDFGNRVIFFGPGGQDRQFETAIAPPPLDDSGVAPDDFSASGVFISANTPHAQLCWTWIKHLSAAPDLFQNGFPARRSVANSPDFLSKAPSGAADVYKAYSEALARSSANVANESFTSSQIDFYWFFRALDHALQGKDLERELADAQTITESFMSCVRSDETPPACAKQADPDYNGWSNAASP